MYYAGEFRSLDQSVDPKGQRYKVLIFTNYDPNNVNSTSIGGTNQVNLGPYPSDRIAVGVAFNTTTQMWEMIFKNIPKGATPLTMTDHPFEVRYEGDDNPYKPHRCSSASISFLQSELNTDFISTLGTNCLVMLLKWRNSVHEVDGHYEDDETGAGLYKHRHVFHQSGMDRDNVYYNDYYPWEFDSFCYDVEWVGFSTPNVLSCNYDHTFDKFTLNCQDAFSTLQYKKFFKDAEGTGVEPEINTITRALLQLGTYKNIFISTAIHFPLQTDDYRFRHVHYGGPFRWMAHQTENYYDENGEPMRWFDVLDAMMNYHSLTAIPWKNSLYIVSDDAIAAGQTEYEQWILSSGSQNRPWMLPGEPIQYNFGTLVNITDTVDITKDKICSAGTTISSTNVYDEVKVVCDEMHPENLFPDLENNENIDTNLPEGQPLQAHPAMANSGWGYWEAYGYGSVVDTIKCYHHLGDKYTGSYPNLRAYWRPDSEKTEVTTDQIYSRSAPLFFDQLLSGQWCFIMDDNGVVSVGDSTSTPHTSSLKRRFFFVNDFHTPAYPQQGPTPEGTYRNGNQTGAVWRWNYDAKDSHTYNPEEYDYRQTMLEIHSKKVLLSGHQYMNIKGLWKFYRNQSEYRFIPSNSVSNSRQGYLEWSPDNAFIYAYVKFVSDDPTNPEVRYLNIINGPDDYAWGSTKTLCRLPLDTSINPPTRTIGTSGGGTRDIRDVAGMGVPFASPIQNLDGLYFKLPIAEDYCAPGHIEVYIDRQIGPTANSHNVSCSTVYTLEDFELNIVSDTYVDTKGQSEPEKENTEYTNVLDSNAVNKFPQIDLILSSANDRGLSYAETCRMDRNRRYGGMLYDTNVNMVNEVSGSYGIPEQLKIEGVSRQYKEPLLMFDMPLFRAGISPVSRFLWNRIGDKRLVVNSLDIDYEYEQCNVSLLQVKHMLPTGTESPTVQVTPITRNLFRTRDIIFDGRNIRRRPVNIVTPIRVEGNDVEVSDYNVRMTTDNQIEGGTRMYMDFEQGRFVGSTPSSGVTFQNNNGHVTLTTT